MPTTHDEWQSFLASKGGASAARLMHLLIDRTGGRGRYIITQAELAAALKVDSRTVRRWIALLRDQGWLQVMNIGGPKSGVLALAINARVAWQGECDGNGFAEFDARVHISQADQERPIDGPALHRAPVVVSYGEVPPVAAPVKAPEPDEARTRISEVERYQVDALTRKRIREMRNDLRAEVAEATGGFASERDIARHIAKHPEHPAYALLFGGEDGEQRAECMRAEPMPVASKIIPLPRTAVDLQNADIRSLGSPFLVPVPSKYRGPDNP